jgi:hypothetical protein
MLSIHGPRAGLLAILLGVCAGACGDGATGSGQAVDETGGSGGSSTGSSSTGSEPDPGVPTSDGPPADTEPGSTSGGSVGGETGGAEGAASGEETYTKCGDGHLDADEECDHGENNDDQGLCTTSCTKAKCGDGWVQPDEICDDGEQTLPADYAGDLPYEGCKACKSKGGFCGDGLLEVGVEECDPLIAAPAKCDELCFWEPRRIFVTSTKHRGDLSDIGEDSGIGAMDTRCNALSSKAGLPGSYRAWLAVSGGSAASRFDMFNDNDTIKFVLVNGEVIAKGFADLLDGPALAINIDESGGLVKPSRVWTNITNTGEATPHDCAQWEKLSDGKNEPLSGLFGLMEAGKRWTQSNADLLQSTQRCEYFARLYCVQYAG